MRGKTAKANVKIRATLLCLAFCFRSLSRGCVVFTLRMLRYLVGAFRFRYESPTTCVLAV